MEKTLKSRTKRGSTPYGQRAGTMAAMNCMSFMYLMLRSLPRS